MDKYNLSVSTFINISESLFFECPNKVSSTYVWEDLGSVYVGYIFYSRIKNSVAVAETLGIVNHRKKHIN